MAHKPSVVDSITCAIVVQNPDRDWDRAVARWADALARLGREYEILVVIDGGTEATTASVGKLGLLNHLRVLTHDKSRGFGAALRTALAEAQHPLFFYTALDYPYAPADLRAMLERIDVQDEITGQKPVLVSGCRTGRPRPLALRVVSGVWRVFCRVVLGLPLDPSPTWLGFRAQAYSYLVWAVFGDPLLDPNSAFKLWRTAFLKRVPIQSDSSFVHVELVAKATFLTSILDEIALSPAPQATPMPSVRADLWRVFRDPDFGTHESTQTSLARRVSEG